ncbi:MAG: PfkB family carbohydrate kinase [Candidatus Dormibacteraeota bacterium]|nr:PfkB family carbohydrate kinase [Candidatus Dormibacteraeota bacterium]
MVNQSLSRPAALVGRFAGLRAVVLGDPILDAFLVGTPTRLCSEQPVPVLERVREDRMPGGAANTAANLSGLGARTKLIGLIGADAAGGDLERCLGEAGVDTSGLVVDYGQPTAHKLRVLAGEHYVARIDTEPSPARSSALEARLLELLQASLAEADLVVVSDYGLGSVSEAAMELVSASSPRLPVVLDAKDVLRHARARVTMVTPNLDEAHKAAGIPSNGQATAAGLAVLGRRLRQLLAADSIAVTMGPEGALLIGPDGSTQRLAALPARARNEVGAGDSLVAASGLGLAAGLTPADALRLGMEAAALAIVKPLTATVTSAELAERLDTMAAGLDGAARLGPSLEASLAEARSQGRRVVFTNGVFDLLHEGHISLLRRARRLGDVLVVGVNSDASARRLKGEGRPINHSDARRAVLQALDCVDHVVVFDGPTASGLLAAVRPDVYVKGDDHDMERVPEAGVARELGARLVTIPRAHAISTSQIIDRVLGVGEPAAGQA